jgi:hypothetical protein
VSEDPIRLLHVQSEHGYTDRPVQAMRGEPEAVAASYQRRLSDQAHRRDRERLQSAWVETAQVIDVALTAFAAIAADDRTVQNGVHAVRRSTEALGRRVAG